MWEGCLKETRPKDRGQDEMCKSDSCKKDGKFFLYNRDVGAAVNFYRIDIAQCNGRPKPKRFWSKTETLEREFQKTLSSNNIILYDVPMKKFTGL